MDRFTRIYSIVLGGIALVLLVFWMQSIWQPKVWTLNDVLENDSTITDYPYQFRVVAFKDGTATISTPRTFDVPAIRFLEIIDPSLAKLAQDDPKVVNAQQELINHQKRAWSLILAQPDVDEVDWELDIQWLADHGVQAPSRR